MEDIEDECSTSHVLYDVGERLPDVPLKAVLGDGVVYVLDCVGGEQVLVTVQVNELSVLGPLGFKWV